MFTLFPMEFDEDRTLLTVVVRDVIFPPGMEMLHRAIKRKIARLPTPHVGLGILCNCLELDTMMNLISEWDVMLGVWDGRISHPFALVVDPAISAPKLRARLSAPNVAVFNDVDSARTWLTRTRAITLQRFHTHAKW